MGSQNAQKKTKNEDPLIVTASITDLVRINLKGLLSNKQSEIAINNAFIDAYEEWEKTHQPGKFWNITHAISGFNRQKRNVEEWSVAKLASDLGVDVAVIRKIFEPKKGKGSGRLSIDEVVELALIFNVTPGYLLQPLREHLERDAIYIFESVRPAGFRVNARDWLLWVHGISAPNDYSSRAMEENLMSLTPEPNLSVSSKREIWPHEELKRISDAQYGSPVSAMLSAQSYPVPGHKMSGITMPKNHPMDSIVRGATKKDRLYERTRSAFAYMQHIRQAIRMVEKESNPKFVREDIEWCLDRMREDLSNIALNLQETKQSNP